MIVNQKNLEIIATDFGNGSKLDFSLFKDSRSVMSAHICTLADSGYQGILDWRLNTHQEIQIASVDQRAKGAKSRNIKRAHFC
jgi:hypothetical protein